MLKKLRWKFILVAMASLFIILLTLFVGINVSNYHIVTSTQDDTLHALADTRNRVPMDPPGRPFGAEPSPEERYMTRFFIIRCDQNGTVLTISMDFIASVTDEDARTYAAAVFSKGKTAGYYGDYRYYVYQDGEETVQIFLNCARELQSMRTLLLLSSAIALCCFIVMFILVFFLSKQAISPFVKNMEIQKRFITDAGHELKTPLTSISTSADILALDDETNEWVQNIQKQSARLKKLVNNLVTLSRLDEEAPIPEKSDFSLSEVLWESIEPFSSLAKATGKTFTQQIENDLMLCGDLILIQQMISILLDNALRYSNDGGFIRLDACRRRKKIIIEVFNTCDLIDTKHLNRLFERFYRTDQSRSQKTGGTGVGLSIAKAIAAAHNGTITVKSQSGNSICFTVTL